jgi:hypothetical protein
MLVFFVRDDGEDLQLTSRDGWVRKGDMISGIITPDQDGLVGEDQKRT